MVGLAASLPAWERGLKLSIRVGILDTLIVAPRVGAWIETNQRKLNKYIDDLSLPAWERGLKHRNGRSLLRDRWSLPAWERGLKQDIGRARGYSEEVAPNGSTQPATKYSNNEKNTRFFIASIHLIGNIYCVSKWIIETYVLPLSWTFL